MMHFLFKAIFLILPVFGSMIPGTSTLMDGFDQLKLTTTQEKFRIFDLNQQSDPIIVNEKPYSISYWTQFNDVNQYKEIYAEKLHSTYSSYFSDYMESYKFSAGYKADDITIGAGYSKELHEVNVMISSENQIVGSSDIWWGQYQLNLGPAFLVPLDPVFQMAISSLSPSPTTEYEQMMYCQTLDSFGTDYVTSVIMGGELTIVSSLDSSYVYTYSETEVKSQMYIGAEYKKASMSYNQDADAIEKQLTEEYMNSSSYYLYETPVPIDQDESTQYDLWKAEAYINPVFVNISLSPIYSLIETRYDLQDRADHFRKTTDYYLKHSVCPTLTDFPPTSENKNVVKGLTTVGCGYDIAELTPRLCIFSNDGNEGWTTWTNPFYPEIQYDVPPYFQVIDTPQVDMLNTTIIMKNISETFYQSHTVVNDDNRFLGFGSKKTTTTDKYYHELHENTRYLAMAMRQIEWYTLVMYTLPYPPYSEIMEQIIETIPNEYDYENDKSYWNQLFDAIGTHVTIRADMGGLVWAENYFESCLTQIYSETWVTEQVDKKYDPIGCFTSHEKYSDDTTVVTEDYEKYSYGELFIQGGTESISPVDWDEWSPTVKNNPLPIRKTLIPIYYFIEDPIKKSVLEKATNDYRHSLDDDMTKTISEMSNMKPPPADICNGFNGEQEDPIQLMQEIIDNAKTELCPHSGYSGLNCLDDNTLYTSTDQINNIGQGYDPVTGTILLPTAELTYSDKIWSIDNNVYKVPNECGINEIDDNINSMIWDDARDLYNNVLNFNGEKLTWINGMFKDTNSLEMLIDSYAHENKVGVVEGINNIYRLKLNDLNLNIYVTQALELLTEEKNDELYAMFFETWGYGTIVDADSGGIIEQQMLLKQCSTVEQPDYDWSALMQSDLPKMFQASVKSGQLEYYSGRRNLLYVQYRGGNPEYVFEDIDKWIASIPSLPIITRVNAWLPWYSIHTNDNVIENLKYYYQQHIEETLESNSQFESNVDKAEQYPDGFAYYYYKGQWNNKKSFIMDPKCTSHHQPHICQLFMNIPKGMSGYMAAGYATQQTCYIFSNQMFSVYSENGGTGRGTKVGCSVTNMVWGQINAICGGGFRLPNIGKGQVCESYPSTIEVIVDTPSSKSNDYTVVIVGSVIGLIVLSVMSIVAYKYHHRTKVVDETDYIELANQSQ